MIDAQTLAQELLFEDYDVAKAKLNAWVMSGQIRNFKLIPGNTLYEDTGRAASTSVKVTLLDGNEITIGQV